MAVSFWDSPADPTLLCSPLLPDTKPQRTFGQGMWNRLGLDRWLPKGKDRRRRSSSSRPIDTCGVLPTATSLSSDVNDANDNENALASVLSTDIFKKRDSLRRDRLPLNDRSCRRALSLDGRRTIDAHPLQSGNPVASRRFSAPEAYFYDNNYLLPVPTQGGPPPGELNDHGTAANIDTNIFEKREDVEDSVEMEFETELDRKWILNLSMHFRERSDREKFFVTFAETPNRWRRVTITCDYRNAEPDSLEHDLRQLHYQRDKNARIYEAIRDSIPEIQFFDTVTNLRLETSEGRLHVHVTEDGNEIITYPSVSTFAGMTTEFIRESDISFEAHLSGFAYHVKFNGKNYVKKEITGPDTVDEFLYEINALHELSGSKNVIQFKGLVVDDRMQLVKGLLIEFAEKGALVDLFYEQKGRLTWARRERWARQIVQGLAEIHEAGFVQGDLTISNMVVDKNDVAKIIDINRRGCPIGWEPPEFIKKLENKQRISMYIGVKSDLYQLGMALWAIAMEDDDPGRKPRPLVIPVDMKIPEYYRNIIQVCLSHKPKDRISAKELLALFPPDKAAVNVEIDAQDEKDIPGFKEDYLADRTTNPIPPKYKHPSFLDQSADSRFTSRRGSATSSEEFLYYPLRQHPLPLDPYVESLPRIDLGNYYSTVKSEELFNNDDALSLSERSVELAMDDQEGADEDRYQIGSGAVEDMKAADRPKQFLDDPIISGTEPEESPEDAPQGDPDVDLARCSLAESVFVECIAGEGEGAPSTCAGSYPEAAPIYSPPPPSKIPRCAFTEICSAEPADAAADGNVAVARLHANRPEMDMDLLTSALPINPAFEALSKDKEQAKPEQNYTPCPESVSVHCHVPPQIPEDLLTSCLPINPAFRDTPITPPLKESSLHHGHPHENSSSSSGTAPVAIQLNGELFSSRLPINPAFSLKPS